jgi:alpha-galactosidase
MRGYVLFSILPLFLLVASCAGQNTETVVEQAAEPSPALSVTLEDLKIEGDLNSFEPTWEVEEPEVNLKIFRLTLRSPEKKTPPKFTVNWESPAIDIYGFWTPRVSLDKADYWDGGFISRAARYAPVYSLYDTADRNRMTFACSDTLRDVEIGTNWIEKGARFTGSLTFFAERSPAMSEYSVEIRIDTRPVPYWEALAGVSRWWAGKGNYKPAPVPDAARQPLYSTWYSFYQNVTADEVVEQCRLASGLGMKAVIVDDGWQTLDSKRGYAFTGDWQPDRIGDMKGFVARVHEQGMKFVLWYSLSLVGEKSRNYERFKGKYLWYWEGQGASVLDPRFPEVREFIIGTYEKALQEWDLDGFKLDFIGMFRPDENTKFEATGGRDFASVDEAVDRLMTDIMARLRAIKPEIMIEFRQPYIGPLMRKYGNMFRATDCPNMAIVNRVRTTDVRLLCGETAAHSDMFIWDGGDPVEVAALQILNILFAVPQVSIRLNEVPQEHRRMIAFWLGYWNDNREVLLDGAFEPRNPSANYPLIMSHKGGKTIAAIYNDVVVPLEREDCKILDVINAKSTPFVLLDVRRTMGEVEYKVYDCVGKEQAAGKINLSEGVHKIAVPRSGLISFLRK